MNYTTDSLIIRKALYIIQALHPYVTADDMVEFATALYEMHTDSGFNDAITAQEIADFATDIVEDM